MITCKAWKGDDLRGAWQVLRKLDGVRALVIKRGPGGRYSAVSRHGKPLYNLSQHAARFTDAEVWLGSFKTTIQAVRTQSPVAIPRTAIYSLDPPDRRLRLGVVLDPTAAEIRKILRQHKRPGEDGLVLRQGTRWLKVKHEETYDVKVTGVQLSQNGKRRGKIGALLTPMGKVGTGFSDTVLRALRHRPLIGETIEVACSRLTPGGKFRHARFVRVREDK